MARMFSALGFTLGENLRSTRLHPRHRPHARQRGLLLGQLPHLRLADTKGVTTITHHVDIRIEVIFSLACPARHDGEGRRIAGCAKGWQSPNPTEPCSTCGLPPSIRGQTYVQPLYPGVSLGSSARLNVDSS